jgi:anti-anti-sigma factor
MLFIQHTEIHGQGVIVQIEGPLDSETSPDFEDYINQLLTNRFRFILLDAADLSWVSSEGIGVTILIQKKIAEINGAFIVFNLSEEILSLYSILGFDKIIAILPDRKSALEMMEHQMQIRSESAEASAPDSTAEDDILIPAELSAESVPEDIFTFDEPPPRRTPSRETPDPAEDPALGMVEDTAGSFEPFVIECARCSSLIRIRKVGDFMCPSCSAEFTVMEDQTVIF